jgi:hypothetical protein
MKKLLFLLICFASAQLTIAQGLTNPGRDDGNRPVIPVQTIPNVIKPNVKIKTPMCNCGNSKTGGGWDGIGFYVGDKPLQKYSCGYQFTVKTYEKIKFASGGYLCYSSSSGAIDCNAVITGTFYKDATVVKTITSFNFSSEILDFTTAGSYRLELVAKCKDKKCAKCTYYFTVL